MSVYFKEARLESGFTQAPNQLLDDKRLSMAARMTWIMLAKHAWGKERPNPGQEGLGELLGVSDRSIRGYLAELKDAGWLESKRRGLGDTNNYFLLIPDSGGTVVPDEPDSEDSNGTVLPDGPEACFRTDRKQASGQDRNVASDIQDNSKDNSKEEPPKPPRGRSRIPAPEPLGFDEWLQHHAAKTGFQAPRGPSTRGPLAKRFAALLGEGYELADFMAVSDGFAASEWRMDPDRRAARAHFQQALKLESFASNVERGRLSSRPLSPEEARRAESMAAFEIANAAAEASGGYA